MLMRNSRRTNLAGVYRADNNDPATCTVLEVATTSGPAAYIVPAYNIRIERRPPQGFFNRVHRAMTAVYQGGDPYDVYAQLVVMRNADEGTNKSVYLGAGLYETNMKFEGVDKNPANCLLSWTPGSNRVYIIMSDGIADLNKRAEEEHLNDFIYAYSRTLLVAQQALTTIARRRFGPFESEDEAREAVRNEFLRQVPQKLRRLGMDMARWGDEYDRLCQKSMSERDVRRWHSFGLEKVPPGQIGKNKQVTYLTGTQRREQGRVYLRVTRGTTEIGQHSPAQVITYD